MLIEESYYRQKLVAILKQLSENPFFPTLKTHKVQVKGHGNHYSASVTTDISIIWDFVDDTIILLITIGGHSGKSKVYK